MKIVTTLFFAFSSTVPLVSYAGGLTVDEEPEDLTVDTSLLATERGLVPLEEFFSGTGQDLLAACQDNSNRNCCIGPNACDFDVVVQVSGLDGDTVGWNVCNGRQACQGFTGAILNQGSCNNENACRNAANDIGQNSCNRKNACLGTTGPIGTGSCNGKGACKNNSGEIAHDSCNGQEACQNNEGEILSDSCNAKGACKNKSGFVGVGSCNANQACKDSTNQILGGCCNANEVCLGNDMDQGCIIEDSINDLVLVVEYSWSVNQRDLDTGTSFLGNAVGFSCGSTGPYLTFSGDDTGNGGSETARVLVGASFADGAWASNISIPLKANWFPSDSTGPALLTVSVEGSTQDAVLLVINPGPSAADCFSKKDVALVEVSAEATGPVTIDVFSMQ